MRIWEANLSETLWGDPTSEVKYSRIPYSGDTPDPDSTQLRNSLLFYEF